MEDLPKILRFNLGEKISTKGYLSPEREKSLLDGRLMVQEKMDGKPVRIETEEFVLFAEDLKITHSIKYRVPARFALYDVYDKRRQMILGIAGLFEVYFSLKNDPGFLTSIISTDVNIPLSPNSFFLVEILERGFFNLNDLPSLIRYSSYGAQAQTWMEGIAVKSIWDSFPFEVRAGKLVRDEFIHGIETNYLKKHLKKNIIDPGKPVVNPFYDKSSHIPRRIRWGLLPPKN